MKSPATDTAPSPEQIAKVKRVQEALRTGQDYVKALEAGNKMQTPRVPASAKAATSTLTVGDGTSALK